MKMMFRINQKQPTFMPKVEPQINIEKNNSQTNNEKRQIFNSISASFRYGMIARIPNSSNCSSCDK